jgi:hypothetical protein
LTRLFDRTPVFRNRRAAHPCASRIEAIEQRPTDPLLIPRHHGRGARAVVGGIVEVAARTGIHGGDQLEVGRERQRTASLADGDDVDYQHGISSYAGTSTRTP